MRNPGPTRVLAASRSFGTATALLVLSASSVLGCGKSGGGDTLTIAAAASLTDAFAALGEAFETKTGTNVRFTFGSSGNLARQIENGAPFDVFAAADIAYIDRLIAKKKALPDSRTLYAYGRLAMWTRGEAIASIGDLTAKRIKRISIAKPEYAPYGQAAKSALQKTMIPESGQGGAAAANVNAWTALESRFVYGSNVRQALQHAETGNADVAFTALSLVLHHDGNYTIVDDALHPPLAQGIVICSRAEKNGKRLGEARAFIEFVNSPEGHAILRTFGLMQPGDAPPN